MSAKQYTKMFIGTFMKPGQDPGDVLKSERPLPMAKKNITRKQHQSAIAIARSVISVARQNRDQVIRMDLSGKLTSDSVKGRKRAVNTLMRYHKKIYIGASAPKDYSKVCIATYHPIDNPTIEGLGVFNEVFDLTKKPGQGEYGNFPSTKCETVAHIDIHVLSRLIHRSGLTNLEDMMSHMKPALSWSLLAERQKKSGNFFVPVSDGIFCCERSRYIGRNGQSESLVRIKTFLHQEEMNSFNRAALQLLRQESVIDQTPRFPSMSQATDKAMTCLQAMFDVGAEWEKRQAAKKSSPSGPGIIGLEGAA